MKYIVSGLNAISEGEWSQIRIIANKCPLETGQAVFEAMSLLKLIDEDVEMNTNCPPVVPKSIKKTPLLQPVVYPNPGTGLFVFEISESIRVDKCIILDMFGRTVWQNSIQLETTSFGADISQHKAGMYLYFFKNGDETIYQGKLIVIE